MRSQVAVVSPISDYLLAREGMPEYSYPQGHQSPGHLNRPIQMLL